MTHEYKVGDRVRVVRSEYPDSVPNGSVVTIKTQKSNGSYTIVTDSSGFEWFMDGGDFGALPPLNLKVGGDCMSHDGEQLNTDTYTRILEVMVGPEASALARSITRGLK